MDVFLRSLLTFVLFAVMSEVASAAISTDLGRQDQLTLMEGSTISGNFHACESLTDLKEYLANSSTEAERFFESKHTQGVCGPVNGNVTINRFLGPMRDGDRNLRYVIQIIVHRSWGDGYIYTSLPVPDVGSVIRHCRPPQEGRAYL